MNLTAPQFSKTLSLIGYFALLPSYWVVAQGQPHVHGQGQLLIAQEGTAWDVKLTLPAADALGFEHAPETKAQRHVYQQLAEQLQNNHKVLSLGAQCELVSATHSLDEAMHHEDKHHEHDHEHEDDHEHGHETHQDVSVQYRFECSSQVEQVSVALFEEMISLESIQLQWVTERGQGMATLNRSTPVFSW